MKEHTNFIPKHTSVLVMGGGPGGAIAAALLAREGIQVTLLEKAKFPRYHIGESLLPSLIPVLDFIGLYEKIDNYGFVKKYEGFFRVKHGSKAGYVNFRKSKIYKHSYQVFRAEFDKLLLDHAQEVGANIFEETLVTGVQFEDKRPIAASWQMVQGITGEISFDYLIDATGLTGLLSNQYLKNRTFQETFANVAFGTYWKNYQDYTDDNGIAYPGAFSMEALTDGSGWLWAIPLHENRLSVGAVVHRDTFKSWKEKFGNIEDIYQHALSLCHDVHKLIKDSIQDEKVRVWQDYSYVASAFAGPNYRIIGDAAGFIDPLFSSGVHLATIGALSAAATICSSIKNELDEAAAIMFHDKYIRQAYTRYVIMVAGMYQQIRSQGKFVLPNITSEDLQLAFDLIQPIVSGGLEIDNTNLTEDELQKTLNYATDLILEAHCIGTDKPSTKIIQKSVAMSTDTIDGMIIRMEKGRLGLMKIGSFESFTNNFKNKFLKYSLRRSIKRLEKRNL